MAFKAGSDSWAVACDDKVLRIKGHIKQSDGGAFQPVDSLIPLLAISSIRLRKVDHASVALHFRVWDGDEYSANIPHGGSPALFAGLLALNEAVLRINVSWPLSTSRALAVRRQVTPGYLRDQYLLGPQGLEEFWSPLCDLPPEWAQAWRAADPQHRWPKAAVVVRCSGEEHMLCVLEEELILVGSLGAVLQYSELGPPLLLPGEEPQPIGEADAERLSFVVRPGVRPQPTVELLEADSTLGLRLQRHDGSAVDLHGISAQHMQPIYRYLVHRWAQARAAEAPDMVGALQRASNELQSEALPPEAYAVLVDTLVTIAAGAEPSTEFPPRERQYLRPRPQPVQPAGSVAGRAGQSGSGARQATSAAGKPGQSGVNTRQVAAGAASIAAAINFFSD